MVIMGGMFIYRLFFWPFNKDIQPFNHDMTEVSENFLSILKSKAILLVIASRDILQIIAPLCICSKGLTVAEILGGRGAVAPTFILEPPPPPPPPPPPLFDS